MRRVFSPNLIKRLSRVPLKDRVLIKWLTIYKRLQPLVRCPRGRAFACFLALSLTRLQGGTSEANKVILHNSGTSAFTEMWNAINNAKHRVDLETYILVPDAIGLKMLECLTEAAKRGCKYAQMHAVLLRRH